MQIVHYRKAHSLSVRVMPFMLQRKVLGCLRGREKKDRRKTGLWQKTALVTERDLSIAQTIPVFHPVIMGFITQPCTSLMLSPHLRLSLCTYAHTHSRRILPHTPAVAQRGIGSNAKSMTTFFILNLLFGKVQINTTFGILSMRYKNNTFEFK